MGWFSKKKDVGVPQQVVNTVSSPSTLTFDEIVEQYKAKQSGNPRRPDGQTWVDAVSRSTPSQETVLSKVNPSSNFEQMVQRYNIGSRVIPDDDEGLDIGFPNSRGVER